jgi:hypothetical protein
VVAAVVAARITPAMMNAASAAWLALVGVGGYVAVEEQGAKHGDTEGGAELLDGVEQPRG